jgi:hypothetical protein
MKSIYWISYDTFVLMFQIIHSREQSAIYSIEYFIPQPVSYICESSCLHEIQIFVLIPDHTQRST